MPCSLHLWNVKFMDFCNNAVIDSVLSSLLSNGYNLTIITGVIDHCTSATLK